LGSLPIGYRLLELLSALLMQAQMPSQVRVLLPSALAQLQLALRVELPVIGCWLPK
jgi:hypothetical protein